MQSRFAFFVALLIAPLLAAAQPLADKLPDDALVYIGWQGHDSMGAAYEQSHLKAVLDASNLFDLFSDFIPRVMAKIGQKDRAAAAQLRAITELVPVIWRCPTALYVGKFDP